MTNLSLYLLLTKSDIDTVMKFLRCKLCRGEVDIVNNDRSINKKTKCSKCGFANFSTVKEPEIVIIRKRPIIED